MFQYVPKSIPRVTVLIDSQIIGINEETVTNIPSTDFPGHWPGESHEWSLEKFKKVCAFVHWCRRSSLMAIYDRIFKSNSITMTDMKHRSP